MRDVGTVYDLVFGTCEALQVSNAVAAVSMLIYHKISDSVDEDMLGNMKITRLCASIIFLSLKINESHCSIRDIVNVIDTFCGNTSLRTIKVSLLFKFAYTNIFLGISPN